MFTIRTVLCLAYLVAVCTACAPVPATPAETGPGLMNAPAALTPEIMSLPETQPIAPAPAGAKAPRGQGACPGLDSRLAQIVSSPSPAQQAQQMLVPVEDGDKIQVVIVLKEPDTAFLQAYGAEPGSQSGNNVQAYVSIARLCDLSKADQVLAIKLPAQAFPQ